jgi:hypothetical protein
MSNALDFVLSEQENLAFHALIHSSTSKVEEVEMTKSTINCSLFLIAKGSP